MIHTNYVSLKLVKLAYLFIFFVLLFNCWGIQPMGSISPDIYLVATLAYMAAAPVLFRNRRFSLLKKEFIPYCLIVAGIVLSMIPAMLFYGQGIAQSIITYRAQLLWLAVPFLFWLSPSKEELEKVTLWVTVCMLFVAVFRPVFPDLFFVAEQYNQTATEEGGNWVVGFQLSLIPLFFALERIKSNFSVKDIAIVLLCMTFLFLNQNRSTLFPAAIILLYTILSNKSKYRLIVIPSLLVLGIGLVLATIGVWTDLAEETVSDLGNDDYNRIKAYLYFLSPQAYPSALTYFLGNGFLSAHSSSEFSDLMDQGIYYSDVGYLGFYNQFGIIPIIAFIIMIVIPFRNGTRLALGRRIIDGKPQSLTLLKITPDKVRNNLYFLKICAVFILVSSLTVGYYGETHAMIFFAIYYYMVFIEQAS